MKTRTINLCEMFGHLALRRVYYYVDKRVANGKCPKCKKEYDWTMTYGVCPKCNEPLKQERGWSYVCDACGLNKKDTQ